MKQLLFTYDPPTPQAAKDAAMARCLGAVTMEWRADAIRAVRELCQRKPEFTADDLDEVAKMTHEKRAIGPLLMECKVMGYCVPTDRYQPSRLRSCHGRVKRVWRSCVYEGDE